MHKVILSVELIIIVLGGKATTNFKQVVHNLLLGVPVFVIVGCPVSIHFFSCPVKNSSHCRHYLNYELMPSSMREQEFIS